MAASFTVCWAEFTVHRSCFLVVCVVAVLIVESASCRLRAATVLSNVDHASSGFGFGVGTNDPTSLPNLMRAVVIRTGLNSIGYRLNSVTLNMGGSTGTGLGDFQLQLFATGPFLPTTSLGDFAVTSNPVVAGEYTFAFTNTSLVLSPQTYYGIVARSPGSTGPTVSQYGWRNTSSGIDPISHPNWLVFDQLVKTEGSSSWTSIRSGPYQFSIDATAVPEPSTAFLLTSLVAGALVTRRRKQFSTIASNERGRFGSTSDSSGFGCNPATRYTAIMSATSEQPWDASERLAHEDGTADKIHPSVIARLIEFKMATLAGGVCT